MHRCLLAFALAFCLALSTGCSSQPSEPAQKSEGGSHLDRLRVKGGAKPNPKGKGVPRT
jgi:hypothetical protein